MYFDKINPKYYESIKDYRQELLNIESEFDGCSQLEKYDDIEKWDLNNKLFESKDTVPPGYSLSYEYLYIEENEVVGMVNFRPQIENNQFLKLYGGHIGYNVKPSKRGKGIGSKMLKDFLEICKNEYSLNIVMISCIKSNEASKKIILNNNGVFESEILYKPKNEMLERYWIDLDEKISNNCK